jgi:hypothetical protein
MGTPKCLPCSFDCVILSYFLPQLGANQSVAAKKALGVRRMHFMSHLSALPIRCPNPGFIAEIPKINVFYAFVECCW